MNPTHRDVPNAVDGRIVRRLDDSSDRCYLTFDDGPDPHWTPRVLETLARAGVLATFFVIGQHARRGASLLREMRSAGHAIGNHGSTHRHPWTMSRSHARREVRDGAAAIADATGEWPGWFRPAHGRLGAFVVEAALAEGQRVALWSVSAVDWGPLAQPGRIASRLHRLRAGDIALLHDGPLRHNHPEHTLAVLPGLLASLARGGPTPAALPSVATMPA